MPQTLLTPIIIFIAVIFCFAVLFIGDFNLLILGALIPPLLLSSARIDLWAMGAMICFFSTLRIPGTPGQIQIYELLIVGMVGLMYVRNLTTHQTPKLTWSKFWCFALLVVLVVLMKWRGSGFKALGSNMWGGATYIHLMVAGFFYLFADQIKISPRAWRLVFIGMFSLAALPALSEYLLAVSAGSIRWHLTFLLPAGHLSAMSGASSLGGPSFERYQSLATLTPVFLLPFLLTPYSGKYRKYYFIVPFVLILLVGLSGHRMVLVVIGITVWVHRYFQVQNKLVFCIISFFIVSTGLLLLGQMAPWFPKPHQRMLSVIPFANIAHDVSQDASGTVTWRIEVWKEAIKLIPRYIWLGKGFAYNVDEYLSQAAVFSESYAIRWALVQTSYHQGVLSLLVGTGLPGTVAGFGFMLSMCFRHFRRRREAWSNATLQRMHNVIYSFFVSQCIIYVLVYGDVFQSFPSLFIYGGILEALSFSNQNLRDRDLDPMAEGLTPAPVAS